MQVYNDDIVNLLEICEGKKQILIMHSDFEVGSYEAGLSIFSVLKDKGFDVELLKGNNSYETLVADPSIITQFPPRSMLVNIDTTKPIDKIEYSAVESNLMLHLIPATQDIDFDVKSIAYEPFKYDFIIMIGTTNIIECSFFIQKYREELSRIPTLTIARERGTISTYHINQLNNLICQDIFNLFVNSKITPNKIASKALLSGLSYENSSSDEKLTLLDEIVMDLGTNTQSLMPLNEAIDENSLNYSTTTVDTKISESESEADLALDEYRLQVAKDKELEFHNIQLIS